MPRPLHFRERHVAETPVGLDEMLAALKIDLADGLSIADAAELGAAHHPPFGPDRGALLLNLEHGDAAAQLPLALRSQYPADHPLELLLSESKRLQVKRIRLTQLDPNSLDSAVVAAYVPPLARTSAFESLQETVAHLRAPEGCPWDRAQTHRSLRRHLLEETYETLEALDENDLPALEEELGDLLLQILLQAQIANEAGEFSAADVVAGIQAKLIRRHPHVFGDLQLDDVEQVLKNWEHFKQAEKGNGVLSGVPESLPALAQADELQSRAARVGFDWPEIEGVLDKVTEELGEIEQAVDQTQQEAELGDLLFSIVNYARWIEVDPEVALRAANQRFRRRFERMSERASQQGKRLDQMGIADLERLWEAAKQETA